MNNKEGVTSLKDREVFAKDAFNISSHYDTHIFNYFRGEDDSIWKQSVQESSVLRYGENPHQKGIFYGNLDELFTKLHGKELSYNNLLDVDAAVQLMHDFQGEDPTFAILKHNNAFGLATRSSLVEAYKDALAGDPVSSFGGILIANREIGIDTANEVNQLFCEVVIAPSYSDEALNVLKQKKNRIILIQKQVKLPNSQVRTLLNGFLYQEKDLITDKKENFEPKTKTYPTEQELLDLEFANKLVKHTKSNTIVLAKNGQLLASGTKFSFLSVIKSFS